MAKKLLEMRSITKEFPGVKALDNVNITVNEGEIHAIVGENGAGKTTLMNVLSGVHPYGTYSGDVFFDGQPVVTKELRTRSARHSDYPPRAGSGSLLSIGENMFLGNEQQQRRA